MNNPQKAAKPRGGYVYLVHLNELAKLRFFSHKEELLDLAKVRTYQRQLIDNLLLHVEAGDFPTPDQLLPGKTAANFHSVLHYLHEKIFPFEEKLAKYRMEALRKTGNPSELDWKQHLAYCLNSIMTMEEAANWLEQNKEKLGIEKVPDSVVLRKAAAGKRLYALCKNGNWFTNRSGVLEYLKTYKNRGINKTQKEGKDNGSTKGK